MVARSIGHGDFTYEKVPFKMTSGFFRLTHKSKPVLHAVHWVSQTIGSYEGDEEIFEGEVILDSHPLCEPKDWIKVTYIFDANSCTNFEKGEIYSVTATKAENLPWIDSFEYFEQNNDRRQTSYECEYDEILKKAKLSIYLSTGREWGVKLNHITNYANDVFDFGESRFSLCKDVVINR